MSVGIGVVVRWPLFRPLPETDTAIDGLGIGGALDWRCGVSCRVL